MNRRTKNKRAIGRQLSVLAALFAVSGAASAGIYNDGKVLATGGVSMTDGAGGGGITPWATITGYETRDGINGDIHYTYVHLPSYDLNSGGVAVGLWDRVELSYTNDSLPTGSTYDTVGLATTTVNTALGGLGVSALDTGIEPFNTTVRMNVFGAKVRVFGEAIYDSDNLIPQVAVGAFYKVNSNKALLKTLGADKSKDFEIYASVTKIFFPISTLINLTGRYTSANQTGLVGFGGPDGNHRTFRFEGSIAYLLNKGTAIGAEYAMHKNNLDGALNLKVAGLNLDTTNNPVLAGALSTLTGPTLSQKESDWRDAFIAFFPSKNLSITMAYAMLGNIVLTPHQDGYYISLQASF